MFVVHLGHGVVPRSSYKVFFCAKKMSSAAQEWKPQKSQVHACQSMRQSLTVIPNPPDEQAPPEHYPEEKTYFASIRSVPAAASTSNLANLAANTRPQGRLSASTSVGSLCGTGERIAQKAFKGRDLTRGPTLQSSNGDGASSRLLSSSKSSAGVHFSPGDVQGGFPDKEGECNEGLRTIVQAGFADKEEERDEGPRRTVIGLHTQRGGGCDSKVADGMRRGSEMASWVTCGAREKSAKDYLW